jgi:uncharacterized membrane protein (DUF4010 family)
MERERLPESAAGLRTFSLVAIAGCLFAMLGEKDGNSWLQHIAGNSGVYLVAFISGLTDADASALSTLRMYTLDRVVFNDAVIAVTLALIANLIFKIGLVISIGGKALARHSLPGLLAIGGGLTIGLLLTQ